jgi:glucuronate isomerase
MQMGIAWWFNDSKYGIEKMIKEYASLAPIGNFLGMLTDSRSFISYVRHEYFRRILSSFLAEQVIKGEYPEDKELLEKLIKGICYFNAKEYFSK